MNILFLSCWYPSKADPLKGIFVKEHAAAIHAAGEKVVVLALNVIPGNSFYAKRFEKFTDERGVETHIIHVESMFYKWIYINPFLLYSILHAYFKREILGIFEPDIIHSNILNPCALLGDRLAAAYKKPHVITEHWSKIDKYMNRNILSGYGKRAYENAAAITVVSHYLKEVAGKYVSNSSKIKVVPNVIDTALFSFSPKIASADKIVFSCLANWTRPKRPELFVNALEEIAKDSAKTIELHVIGEGVLLEEIKRRKLSYSVVFHGKISRMNIAELIQHSDYFLHASDTETFSMVCAEALSTGTPVIASNVGAIPELVNVSNGVLSDNTVKYWVEAIRKAMVTSYDSRVISQTMGERYSKESVGALFRKIYQSVRP